MIENDSLAIKISRVICIFFVSYVHVNPSMDRWVDEVPEKLSIFGTIGTILLDVLGRASVPALSILGAIWLFQPIAVDQIGGCMPRKDGKL